MHPKDTQFADWLSWFTADSEDSPVTGIFALPDGRRAATDGRMAVVTDEPGTVTTPKRQSIPAALANMLKQPALHESGAITGDKLREAVGPCSHPEPTICSKCRGMKETPHYCDCELCEANTEPCELCDETGIIWEYGPDNYCTLWGTPFDRNKIAYVLEHAPQQEQYTVRLTDGLKKDPDLLYLHIITPHWHAIVTSMVERVKREHVCPKLMDLLKETVPA